MTDPGDWTTPRPFLESAAATTACRRQLEQLAEELANAFTALQTPDAVDSFVMKVSPDRWIVQLGPVALTIAWVRNAREAIAAGELMMIVWHGVPGPRATFQAERPHAAYAASATALWEEILLPVADSAASWGWRSPNGGVRTTSEVAASCAARVQDEAARRSVAKSDDAPPR